MIHFPLLARSIQAPFFCGLQTRNAYHLNTPYWATPLFWSKPFSLVAEFEGDNGLGFSKAPWSTALNALFLHWNEIAFSPLWSKWSLPSALLRMLKRHPSRNCTWDGGGCDWIRWRGRDSQRAHHYNNLPDSYATAKKLVTAWDERRCCISTGNYMSCH